MRLLRYFRFLKYGVALVLALIGLKLIVSKWVEVESLYSLAGICIVFFFSMVVSILFPEAENYEEQDDEPSGMYPQEKEHITDFTSNGNRRVQALEDDDDLPMPEDFEVDLSDSPR